MAKRTKSRNMKLNKAGVDRELAKDGLTYGAVAGAIIFIIGALLILFNLAQVLQAVIGLVLIYFGLKMLGYKITL
ncbi:MAG: hypothetical protein ACYCO0_02165 [Candidatus Micrarchaeaceae archaeon]